MRTLLIDGDEILYKAAAACEREVRWDDQNHVLWSNLEEVYFVFTSSVDSLMSELRGDRAYIAFTGPDNFRRKLYPGYKASRPRKPLCYAEALERIKSKYTVRCYAQIEADDLLGIWGTSVKLGHTTIVSSDKDMKTIPGELYRQGSLQTIAPAEADYWWMTQTLTGDITDGYPGAPGIGEKTAEKILAPAAAWETAGITYLEALWRLVVAAYESKGLTKDDALLQARLARILRAEDWDSEKQEVKLWTP